MRVYESVFGNFRDILRMNFFCCFVRWMEFRVGRGSRLFCLLFVYFFYLFVYREVICLVLVKRKIVVVGFVDVFVGWGERGGGML